MVRLLINCVRLLGVARYLYADVYVGACWMLSEFYGSGHELDASTVHLPSSESASAAGQPSVSGATPAEAAALAWAWAALRFMDHVGAVRFGVSERPERVCAFRPPSHAYAHPLRACVRPPQRAAPDAEEALAVTLHQRGSVPPPVSESAATASRLVQLAGQLGSRIAARCVRAAQLPHKNCRRQGSCMLTHGSGIPVRWHNERRCSDWMPPRPTRRWGGCGWRWRRDGTSRKRRRRPRPRRAADRLRPAEHPRIQPATPPRSSSSGPTSSFGRPTFASWLASSIPMLTDVICGVRGQARRRGGTAAAGNAQGARCGGRAGGRNRSFGTVRKLGKRADPGCVADRLRAPGTWPSSRQPRSCASHFGLATVYQLAGQLDL